MTKLGIEIFDYLHDTGVASLHFDFENKTISIEFLLWDDQKQEEVKLTLTLYGVTKFASDLDENLDFNVIGCHDAICKQISENQYQVIFLFDFFKQAVAWKVTIHFESLEIKGGLSKKAFQHKYLSMVNV